jgi:hypothetical protein
MTKDGVFDRSLSSFKFLRIILSGGLIRDMTVNYEILTIIEQMLFKHWEE